MWMLAEEVSQIVVRDRPPFSPDSGECFDDEHTERWISRHKVWSGIIAAVVVVGVIGALSSTPENRADSSSDGTYYDPGNVVESPEDSGSSDDSSYEDSSSSYSSESSGQENAREQAENYLSFSAFSRKGLIKQLEFEGYSTADASYAVDAIGADWNEQAALKAKAYLDQQSFSRSGLQEQLEFEGFTPSQASYGVSSAY